MYSHVVLFSLALSQILIAGSQARPQATQNEVLGNPVKECPGPWFRMFNQCFLLVNEKSQWLPWESARAFCGTLAPGADLAIPSDFDVHTTLTLYTFDKTHPLLEALPKNQVYLPYWLGGSDLSTEGEWLWVNGNIIPTGANSTGWHYKEPNDNRGEDCLEMRPNFNPHVSLNDAPCEKKSAFICERY